MNLEYFEDKINDELDGAKDYIKNAIEIKAMDSNWAKMFSTMSATELEHANALYTMANEYYNKIIKSYSEAPSYLKDIHSNIVNCYTKKYAEVKFLHEAYNK